MTEANRFTRVEVAFDHWEETHEQETFRALCRELAQLYCWLESQQCFEVLLAIQEREIVLRSVIVRHFYSSDRKSQIVFQAADKLINAVTDAERTVKSIQSNL